MRQVLLKRRQTSTGQHDVIHHMKVVFRVTSVITLNLTNNLLRQTNKYAHYSQWCVILNCHPYMFRWSRLHLQGGIPDDAGLTTETYRDNINSI
jgi:hypothetical protein